MWDSGSTNTTSSSVYVLQYPANTRRMEVFRTFDSKAMEDSLSSLPRGSVVIYDVNTWDHVVPAAQAPQFESLKTCCQKKGVKLALPIGGN